ncbi:ATP synthase F1 subunit delta [Sphingobacteriaceae bacterium]|nr:ATP synthase F1 subunit delta [Sphingobacteriaceae bacterium]
MIVANRYAKSLMELAVESKQLDAVRADMKTIEQVCAENREFELFLNSPVIKTDKKLVVMSSLFKGKISDLTLSFLNLVTSKHRESIIHEITKAFEDQYRSDKNIFTAVVTSAKGLDATTKQKVADLIKSQLKGEVEIVEKIDANTIGGFIIRIGDKQIDKTVARQLSNLKKELLNTN